MDTGPTDDQCARALCNSRIIALIVSNNTFKGIADLEPESQCEVRLSSLLLHYEMVLEIFEHRPHTRVLPIFYEDRGVPDRFENIDKRAFCFSDQWLAKLKSQLKFHSVSQKALHLLRRHDGELARKLDNKQLKLGGVSIPSLIGGRRLKETMRAIAGLEPYEIEAMPKDRAIALLVEHVLKMLNTCPPVANKNDQISNGLRDSSKRALESDGPEAGTALKMPRTDDDGERASTALKKRGGITLGDAGEGSSSNAKKTKQDSTSARTQGGGSTTLGKRDSSIECDQGGGSSSRKRIKQDSMLPSAPEVSHVSATGGGNGGAAVHQNHASVCCVQ